MAFSVTGTITIADVRDGAPGAPGADANFYKNVYLYAQGTSAPAAPTSSQGFNSTTGDSAAVGSWSTSISSITQGNTVWIADARLVQTEGTGSWANDSGWSVNAAGYRSADGNPGSDAPRFTERKLYTNPAVSTTPSTPSATITWSTGALSSITSGWSETPPTQVATSSDSIYESTLLFIDTSPPFSTTTTTGSSPRVGISFSGLVTFDSGAFAVDGSTITNIDGGNIQTGTISANELTVNIRGDIGAGTGNGNGNGNSNLTNANVAIGGTQITSGTVATGRLPSDAINKNDQYNLVDPRNWDVGTDAGDGFGRTYTFNENDGAANERIVGEDAFGTESIIWQTIPDSGNDADGGWNCDFEIYKTTDTLLYVNYVKRITTQSSGSYYLGCHGSSTLNLSGTANTNPYFVANGVGELPVGVWCAVVGVIYGSSSTKTTNDPIGGVYRLDTGQKIRSTTSFRMKTGVTLQRHRAYLYYSSDNATRLQFCKPGVYVVNGSEPTLGQILGPVAAINNSSNTIDGSSITSNTITASQLVNNIRVDIGAGTGNGNGNGNGNSNLTNTNVSINAAKVNDFTSTVQTTNINGGYINTGVVAGGNLSINSTTFQPNAGQGFALGTSGGTGRLSVGNTTEYLWWDGSHLTIRGEIVNFKPAFFNGNDGNWGQINNSQADLSNVLDGAGFYVFCIIGNSGPGGASRHSDNTNVSGGGGGGGGVAIVGYEWDGTTTLGCSINTTLSNANNNFNSGSPNAGGSFTFSVGGSTVLTITGGQAPTYRGAGNNNVGNYGGNGGQVSGNWVNDANLINGYFQHGGRGGLTVRSTSGNNAMGGGGGAVDVGQVVQNNNAMSNNLGLTGGNGLLSYNAYSGGGASIWGVGNNSITTQITADNKDPGVNISGGANYFGVSPGSIYGGTPRNSNQIGQAGGTFSGASGSSGRNEYNTGDNPNSRYSSPGAAGGTWGGGGSGASSSGGSTNRSGGSAGGAGKPGVILWYKL